MDKTNYDSVQLRPKGEVRSLKVSFQTSGGAVSFQSQHQTRERTIHSGALFSSMDVEKQLQSHDVFSTST